MITKFVIVSNYDNLQTLKSIKSDKNLTDIIFINREQKYFS